MTTIRAIGSALPEMEVTNADLDRDNPSWGMHLVAELAGVRSRRIAAVDETAFDLSVRACESLLARPGLQLGDIDAILYCTQDPDYPRPGNAHLLHEHLGLSDDVLAFDYNLACSGFVYGLTLADALARGGMAAEILLVTAETQSKRMNPRDRSVKVLLGDGAAVTHISAGDGGGGRIVDCELCTHGRGFKYGYIPAGGARNPSTEETKRETTDRSGNVRSAEQMHMEGAELWSFVNSTLPGHIDAFLAKRSLTLGDIDLFVFHQASKLILNSLTKSLALPPEKVFTHLSEIGNLASASIPFALRAALDQGAIRPGDRVLLSAFGVGISYGSVIVEFAPDEIPAA
jgi:3-oxoacyl-[acyl-carrier-protein] synthase III